MGDGGGNQAFCRPYNVDAGLKLSLQGFGARIVNETKNILTLVAILTTLFFIAEYGKFMFHFYVSLKESD